MPEQIASSLKEVVTMPQIVSKLNRRRRSLRKGMQLNEGTFNNCSRFLWMQSITVSTNYAAETCTNTKMVKLGYNITVV